MHFLGLRLSLDPLLLQKCFFTAGGEVWLLLLLVALLLWLWQQAVRWKLRTGTSISYFLLSWEHGSEGRRSYRGHSFRSRWSWRLSSRLRLSFIRVVKFRSRIGQRTQVLQQNTFKKKLSQVWMQINTVDVDPCTTHTTYFGFGSGTDSSLTSGAHIFGHSEM